MKYLKEKKKIKMKVINAYNFQCFGNSNWPSNIENDTFHIENFIRSQEKNQNRDSNLGPPSALPLELSWFSCQLIFKSPSF
jgi:hypothetical protein